MGYPPPPPLLTDRYRGFIDVPLRYYSTWGKAKRAGPGSSMGGKAPHRQMAQFSGLHGESSRGKQPKDGRFPRPVTGRRDTNKVLVCHTTYTFICYCYRYFWIGGVQGDDPSRRQARGAADRRGATAARNCAARAVSGYRRIPSIDGRAGREIRAQIRRIIARAGPTHLVNAAASAEQPMPALASPFLCGLKFPALRRVLHRRPLLDGTANRA